MSDRIDNEDNYQISNLEYSLFFISSYDLIHIDYSFIYFHLHKLDFSCLNRTIYVQIIFNPIPYYYKNNILRLQ